jgi:hypothetical protein
MLDKLPEVIYNTPISIHIFDSGNDMTSALLSCELMLGSPDELHVRLMLSRSGAPPEPIMSPLTIPWNNQLLLEKSLNPEAYGQALSRMLFTPDLRERIASVTARYDQSGDLLRFQIHIPPEERQDALQRVRWETLSEPSSAKDKLFLSQQLVCSRHLPLNSPRFNDVILPARHEVRALIAVANPRTPNLTPIDVDREVDRARAALLDIPSVVLAGNPSATPHAILSALEQGIHILYLVCHGTLSNGTDPYLWLESEEPDTRVRPYSARSFSADLSRLPQPPLLVVLISCVSAINRATGNALDAIGPQLAQSGIGAVVAMQEEVGMSITALFPKAMMQKLHASDGNVELALAAARRALLAQEAQSYSTGDHWWRPVLWSRLPDGRAWAPTKARVDLAALLQTRSYDQLLAVSESPDRSGWDLGTLQLYRAFGLLRGENSSRVDETHWQQVEAALLSATEAGIAQETAATAWALLMLAKIDRFVLRRRTIRGIDLGTIRQELCALPSDARDQSLIETFPATPEARARFAQLGGC